MEGTGDSNHNDDIDSVSEAMKHLTNHCVVALRDPDNVTDSLKCTSELVAVENALRRLKK